MRAHAPTAWTPNQQISLITGLGFSALLVLAGYIGTSGEARLTDQYPWVTVAALGVAVSGVVHARWLLAGLVAIRTLQRDVLSRVATTPAAAPTAAPTAASGVRQADTAGVTVPGTSRYVHRPDCPMVRDKPTAPASPDSGRASCGVCAD